MQQVGMKCQAPSGPFERRTVGLGAEYLSRCDENQCVFLEVVRTASVGEVVRTLQLFQENQIHADVFAGVRYGMLNPASFDYVD